MSLSLLLLAIASLVVHEAAHSYAADHFGDPFPRALGRVSWNPLVHLDPVGSILLPGLLWSLGLIPLGYGRSAPVSRQELDSPSYIAALLAGPWSNLVLAGLLVVAWPEAAGVNAAIGIFNLLPIPPLDGGRIVLEVWRSRP
ncbi:MAG: site-2 protease family protein [Longimicrobiales bacterium]